MIPLTRLKRDVQLNTELTKVVDVLKGIAATRLHILERERSVFAAHFSIVEEFLSLADWRQVRHPFLQPSSDRTGVIMVTSDAGFLGGLNTQIVNAGLAAGGPEGLFTIIGERGLHGVGELRERVASFPGIQDATKLSLALDVRDHVTRQVLSGRCGGLVVVYPHPVSFTAQEVTVETLLPAGAWERWPEARPFATLVWESRPEEMIEYVMMQWVGYRLHELFALSRLAELAARVVHLEGSHQELTRRGKKLRFDYFRARHELMDRSMREIFAAQLLYGHVAAN